MISRTTPVTTALFAGLLGHEDVTFFAVVSLTDPRPLVVHESGHRLSRAALADYEVTAI